MSAERREALKEEVKAYVEDLQNRICRQLEELDGTAGFREDRWSREEGGGGITRVMTDGAVFEKAGVNTSAVFGELPEEFAAQLQGDGTTFYATGISLVLHPRSPMIPTTHANVRYIVQGESAWFGGGSDLTPYYLFDEDCTHFHRVLQQACDDHDPSWYMKYKQQCDEYFHLAHRNEGRGVGGIFYDGLKPDEERDLDALFAFMKSVGEAIMPAYAPIVERRRNTGWGEKERAWQLLRRGRYVEFNLIYDRGTIFGLKTRGRVESILMSLPPIVHYPYDPKPPGDRETRLLEVLRNPRSWL